MALAVLVRTDAAERRLDAVLIFGTLFIVAMVSAVGGTAEGYGTDELAYGQAAASALLHGVNPYTADFTSALHSFGVASGATMTLHGTVVPSIAYPSPSFLVYVPAVALLGDQSYAAFFTDIIAWIVSGALLWRMLSPSLRPWVPIFLAVPVLLVSIVGGTNDSLYVPFELLALCCWDRFGDPSERSIARWIGPVALGLACGMKQHPWLIAPFLAAGVGFEAHTRGQDGRRVALRYVVVASAVFLVPNIPFILWGPSGWFSRILLPVTGGLVPMGIGPAGLLRAYSIGGGNLAMFGLASVAALFGVMVLFVRRYGVLRQLIPLLPLAALFVSSRNFSSYFAFGVPALAVGAASLRASRGPGVRRSLHRPLSAVAALAGAVSLAAVTAALAWPAPASVAVDRTQLTATHLDTTVHVTNSSDRTITPHFILAKGSAYDQAMQIVNGPATLAPHSTTSLDLTTPVGVMTPRAGDSFQVQVATTAPDSFASSPVTKVPTGT
jgi:hypothetical protein